MSPHQMTILSCALVLATNGCTALGMGIGATADHHRNDIAPRDARRALGRPVVVEVRDRAAPVSGRLSARRQEPRLSRHAPRAEVCVDDQCIPDEKVLSVQRADGTSSGFWIGAGVGAAIDVALVLAVAAMCTQGACEPGDVER